MLSAYVVATSGMTSASPGEMKAVGYKAVTSWYDSGIRLAAPLEMAEVVGRGVPTGSATTAAELAASPVMVQSWYDSGMRLAASEATAAVADMVEPMVAAPAEPVAKQEPRHSLRPEGVSTRPAYVWNPVNLGVDTIPNALGPVSLEPFRAQFVPEYVTGVPSYLDKTWKGDVGFDPWALVALAKPSSPGNTRDVRRFLEIAHCSDGALLQLPLESTLLKPPPLHYLCIEH